VAILTPRLYSAALDHRLFDELGRRVFSQRRKQLKKQLPEDLDWEQAAEGLGVSVTARAEELTLEQWIELTRACDPHPLSDTAQKAGEVFDVVDEDDQVIGQKTRAEVHAQGLIHRAVHVFVIGKKGQLLLQKRSMLKDVHPGTWDSSVAGHVDAGETYEEAAIRELEEEMGITVEEPPRELRHIKPCEGTGWEHVKLFRVPYTGPITYPAAEIESALWFPLEEVQAWLEARPQDFASGFIECWKAMQGGE
jgi:16S rRNA (adenine1518-N6/adenine1519-N6)-dimethyltransferase